jgi:hypothetical protein
MSIDDSIILTKIVPGGQTGVDRGARGRISVPWVVSGGSSRRGWTDSAAVSADAIAGRRVSTAHAAECD